MKLTTFLLILGILQVSAATFAQKVTLKEKNASLKDVFSQIRSQTGYDFVITSDLLQQSKPITIEVNNAELTDVLNIIFDNQPLAFTLSEKTVIVSKKEPSLIDRAKAIFAQTTVTGKVTDGTNQPMAGVTVREKDTQNATVTDAKGKYSLNVTNDKAIIVFSYIGYETQELQARNIPDGSVIVLKAESKNLQEVVISKGYYDEKQEYSTGDVSVVSAKEIAEQPVSDPLQALEGRVAGLNIQQNSGLPGSYATVRINGVNSIAAGTAPLYIIDGVPFSAQSLSSGYFTNALGAGNSNGSITQPGPATNSFASNDGYAGGISPLSALNLDDIESIEVLKDADATAIYGSKGANGVVLITTKKGKAGATQVNVNMSQGIGQVTRMMDLLNTQQYLQMRREAFANDGLPVPSIATNPQDNNYDIDGVWDTTRYTNWQKVLIGNTAHYTDANVSVSGGNTNTQFLLGAGYNRQTTVFPGDYGDKKASVNLSLTHSSADQRFHLQFSASYTDDNNDVPGTDFTNYILLAPDAPALYNPNGSINWQIENGRSTFSNPLAQYTAITSTSVADNLISDLDLSYQVLPGLKLSGNFGYNHEEMNENVLTPSTAAAPPRNTNPLVRQSAFSNNFVQTWNIEPKLSYDRKIGPGVLNTLIGTTFQQTEQQSTATNAYGFPSDALISDPKAASFFRLLGDNYSLNRYESIYARIGYVLNDKYLLNITGRRDGSSVFGPDREFGNFGAVGLGWIFSKEKLIADNLPWLSFGKLRGSYGTSGNDQVGNYQYLSTYNINSNTYQGNIGLAPNGLTNPYYQWELDKKLEGGLDLGFLKDRLNLSINYFRSTTDNQLVGYPLPAITGFTSVEYNLPAVIQNTGLEIDLNTVNVKAKDFNWSSSLNFTLPSNKLVSYPNIAESPYNELYKVGQSLFVKYLFKETGVNPQTGVYNYVSSSGNSNAPVYGQDQIFSQALTQAFYGGWANNFTYKNFGLDIFIQFVKQNGVSVLSQLVPGYFNGNIPTAIFNDAWKTPGQQTAIGKLSTQYGADPNGNYPLSTGPITDASFIRVKTVAFSYKLPQAVQKAIHSQNAKVFLDAQNLFTFTHYLGLDPETGALTLPPLRMITAGVSATF